MKLWILLVVLITLATGCDDLIKPKEVCIVASTGKLGCDDPRRAERRQYTRDLLPGDLVTNREDYFETEKEIIALIKELKKAKYDLKRCRAR